MKTSIDIAIIGAGPQALTLVTHLLQKKKSMRNRLMVFDPSGRWMQQWYHQFSAFQIPHLRSPSPHHPHPNPQALRNFGEHRRHEFFPPYDLPGTQPPSVPPIRGDVRGVREDLIQNLQLQNTVYPARVLSLTPLQRKFQLYLSTGETLTARRVVLAVGAGKPIIPDWAKQLSSLHLRHQLCHSSQIDLRNLSLRGEIILIVGGGLTSGHLALGATKLGATVILMARRNFQEKLFDADPGWLGPKYLKGFWAETDWYQRFQLLQTARNGGSMTQACDDQVTATTASRKSDTISAL
ncbi:FAD/NAD(P)-binding protein [Halothece sp. PCC 7418]|uniref:FAD/NAD(P)-binding protein n=1 Tax=Halothece sp. (strain PCC 7418) TaxID=65093 RepID=UPI00268C5981|nr:FAD/NAD(P)-binding protein [Halothece sp. PCC 7418]